MLTFALNSLDDWPPDEVLAEKMRSLGVKAPVEKIVVTDYLLTAVNRDRLGADMRRRIVDLECGHKAVTSNARECACGTCHEMILSGRDYEGFRNRGRGGQ